MCLLELSDTDCKKNNFYDVKKTNLGHICREEELDDLKNIQVKLVEVFLNIYDQIKTQ